jgi:hypothetical protein
MGISFLRFGKFSAIILLDISYAFSSPLFSYLMPMIPRFNLFMELQSSCIFLSQLFNLFSMYSSAFSLKYVLFRALMFCLPLLPVCWSGFQH